jgi:hypothetical protein
MSAAKPLLSVLLLLVSLSCAAQSIPGVPRGLFEPLDISESIPVSIVDLTSASSVAASDDAELARWALEDWTRALDGALEFHIVDSEDDALVRIRFVPPGGGQYGEMLALEVAGKRGAAVFVRPDTQALGPIIARRAAGDSLFRETIVYLTCLHELGHALGLPHTDDFADIMYAFGFGGDIEEYFMRYRRRVSSRADIADQSGLSAADRDFVRSLYSIGEKL